MVIMIVVIVTCKCLVDILVCYFFSLIQSLSLVVNAQVLPSVAITSSEGEEEEVVKLIFYTNFFSFLRPG